MATSWAIPKGSLVNAPARASQMWGVFTLSRRLTPAGKKYLAAKIPARTIPAKSSPFPGKNAPRAQGIGGAICAREITRLVDTNTKLANRVKTATVGLFFVHRRSPPNQSGNISSRQRSTVSVNPSAQNG